jgi:hypothetical protein
VHAAIHPRERPDEAGEREDQAHDERVAAEHAVQVVVDAEEAAAQVDREPLPQRPWPAQITGPPREPEHQPRQQRGNEDQHRDADDAAADALGQQQRLVRAQEHAERVPQHVANDQDFAAVGIDVHLVPAGDAGRGNRVDDAPVTLGAQREPSPGAGGQPAGGTPGGRLGALDQRGGGQGPAAGRRRDVCVPVQIELGDLGGEGVERAGESHDEDDGAGGEAQPAVDGPDDAARSPRRWQRGHDTALDFGPKARRR